MSQTKKIILDKVYLTGPVKRDSGKTAQSLSICPEGNGFIGWEVESTKIDQNGNLLIIVTKEQN